MSIYKNRSADFERRAAQAVSGGRPEEALTWLYQSVVLLLDGYLVEGKDFPNRPRDHEERRRAVEQCPELLPGSKGLRFKNTYRDLKNLSEQFRYDPEYSFHQDHLRAAQEKQKLLNSILWSKYGVSETP